MTDLMAALFESVDDGIVVGDANGQILFGNEAAKRINDNFDYPKAPEERALHYFSDDDAEKVLRSSDLPLRRALVEGEVRGLELVLVTPTGAKKNLVCNGRALYDPGGNRIGAVLTIHDRTQEKVYERHQIRLEQERSELLRINEELERFSSVAAHDLKSPLNSITQFAELLREDLAGRIGPDEDEMLQRIQNAGTRLRQLIDDLLAFARSGKGLGEISSVDVGTMVDQVLASLSSDLQKAKAFVEVGPMPVVFADKVGLTQVFQNLIANAVKYHGESDPIVQISAVDGNGFWRFNVKDNGRGFKKEDLCKAFELFKRFEVSDQLEGTGLGLPICKKIVEAHGGELQVDSESGRGTTMTFTLPKYR